MKTYALALSALFAAFPAFGSQMMIRRPSVPSLAAVEAGLIGQWQLYLAGSAGEGLTVSLDMTAIPDCGGYSLAMLARNGETSILDRVEFGAGSQLFIDHLRVGDARLTGILKLRADDTLGGVLKADSGGGTWDAVAKHTAPESDLVVESVGVNFNSMPRTIEGTLFLRDPDQPNVRGHTVRSPSLKTFLVCYAFRLHEPNGATGASYSFDYSDNRTYWAPMPMSDQTGTTIAAFTNAGARLEVDPLLMTIRNKDIGSSIDVISSRADLLPVGQ